MFAGLILCVIVVPGAVDTLQIVADFDDFERSVATVTAQRTQKHNRGPDTVVLEFEYRGPDGTPIRGDNALTRFGDDPALVDELVTREGGVDRVVVYFDRKDPRRVVIREVSPGPSLGLIGLSLLLLFGGVHASVIDRRRRRLQARGDEARSRRERARDSEAT